MTPPQNHKKKMDTQKCVTCRPFKVEQWTLPRIWEGLIKQSDYMARRKAVEEYNEQNFWRKRGISINPCRYTPTIIFKCVQQ